MTHTTTPKLEVGDKVYLSVAGRSGGFAEILNFENDRGTLMAEVEWEDGCRVAKTLRKVFARHSLAYLILEEKAFQPYDPLQQGEEDGDI